MQDITPPNQNRSRRSIRDISPPDKKDQKKKSISKQSAKSETVEDTEDTTHQKEFQSSVDEEKESPEGFSAGRRPGPQLLKRQSGQYRRTGWIWSGVIVVGLAVFLGSYLFSGAEVIIVPREEAIDLEAEYRVVKDHLTVDNDFDLVFNTVTERHAKTKPLAAEGQEEVSRQASGKITIYNEFSDASQTLVATTRFEDPQGRIFRMPESVTVPGITAEGEPGTVTVEVVAAGSGEEYNIEPTEFTLPGFREAGAPQYDSIYGKSVESFTGGFEGVRPVVSEAERESVEEELKRELETEMIEGLTKETPEDHYLLPGASFFEFDSELSLQNDGASAELTVFGKLHGVLIKTSQLSTLIAQDFVEKYEGEDVRINNWEELEFTVLNEDLGIETESIDLRIDGQALLGWEIDQEKIQQDLARTRRTKDNVDRILRTYENQLLEVEIGKIRPFWRLSLPAADNIKITIISNDN